MITIKLYVFFFFNGPATTEIYTLSLHAALPILRQHPRFIYLPILAEAAPRLFILPISRCGSTPLFILPGFRCSSAPGFYTALFSLRQHPTFYTRSEEHTSELQSPMYLVCRLLLEKKKKQESKKRTYKRRMKTEVV